MTDGVSHFNPSTSFIDEQLHSTLNWLRDNRINVAIISPTPYTYPTDIGACTRKALWRSLSPSRCNFYKADTNNEYRSFMEYAKERSDFYPFFDLSKITCPNGQCLSTIDSTILYRDWGHLSIDGSIEIGKNDSFVSFINNSLN